MNEYDQARMQSQRLLYMDTANYCYEKFFEKKRWNLARTERNVKLFCQAAKASGWKVVAFLDQAAMTKEAQKKWRKRREREVKAGKRNVPAGALRLLGDMFAKHGVEVKYSLEADCDDTIAFHAQAHGASVLSQDRDFFRYKGSTFRLFKNFAVKKKGERLFLIKQDKVKTTRTAWLRDLGPPPATTGKFNPFRDCLEGRTYLRGAPSPLSGLDNLHITVRPLRQALYSHLRITNPVEEEFPVRVGSACVWDKKMVPSDDALKGLLLDSPESAVSHFGGERPEGSSDEDWFKHQFALRSVVAELCCSAQDRTLLETLEPLVRSIDDLAQKRQPNKAVKRAPPIPTLSRKLKMSENNMRTSRKNQASAKKPPPPAMSSKPKAGHPRKNSSATTGQQQLNHPPKKASAGKKRPKHKTTSNRKDPPLTRNGAANKRQTRATTTRRRSGGSCIY